MNTAETIVIITTPSLFRVTLVIDVELHVTTTIYSVSWFVLYKVCIRKKGQDIERYKKLFILLVLPVGISPGPYRR